MRRRPIVICVIHISHMPRTAEREEHEECSGICDKCGKPVPKWNDATIIEAELTGNSLVVGIAKPRHFLPTEDCAGSPSRAQYIAGQPRDTRGYTYEPHMEARWRRAHANVLARYKKN